MEDSSSLPNGLCYTTKDTAVNVLSEAFQDDSFHRYVLATWDMADPGEAVSVALNRRFFSEMLTELEAEGAIFLGVPDAPMVMVWWVHSQLTHILVRNADGGMMCVVSLRRLEMKTVPMQTRSLPHLLRSPEHLPKCQQSLPQLWHASSQKVNKFYTSIWLAKAKMRTSKLQFMAKTC